MPEPSCYMSLGLPVDTPLVNKQGVTNQVLSSCDLGEWQATELLVKVEMLVICKAVFICESHSIWKLKKKKPERTNNKSVTYCQVSWANRPIFWDLLGSRCWMLVMRFSCIFRGMVENSSESIQSAMHCIPPPIPPSLSQGTVPAGEYTEGALQGSFLSVWCSCSRSERFQ